MPTVIGINQVPANIPRPNFWDYYGQFGGTSTRQVTDALLAALTAGTYKGNLGQVPTTPTASNPGTFNFPAGSQSPLEAAQIQQLGGVPTTSGFNARSTQNPGAGGVSYTQPTRLGFKPDLTYQLNQAKLQQAQQQLDPNSPINQFLTAQSKRMLQPTTQQPPDESNDALAKYLAKRALSPEGDPEAEALLEGMGY